MKATVSGISIEGTPDEIAEVIRRYEVPRVTTLKVDISGSGGTDAAWATTKKPAKKPSKKPSKKRLDNGKSAPFDYGEGGVKRLLKFLRANGGRAFPGAVSKRFSLTPFQRRKLVAAARKAKKIKVGGNKRSTWYEVR